MRIISLILILFETSLIKLTFYLVDVLKWVFDKPHFLKPHLKTYFKGTLQTTWKKEGAAQMTTILNKSYLVKVST